MLKSGSSESKFAATITSSDKVEPKRPNSGEQIGDMRAKMAPTPQGLPVAVALAAALVLGSCLLASGQSTKGGPQLNPAAQQQRLSDNTPGPAYSSAAQSPGAQIRQQQQQQYSAPASNQARATGQSSTKRRQPSSVITQQRQEQPSYAAGQQESAPSTEDPLADSEPALYGSVAGQPGVDFPAYTRIPKTSFTCEGKGFDFGFYADEEAGCQVYHVCWSGRRESFLCGVGTVFNQAILACDYWHSVDCSKSSQFYGVNSELGKASGEPAAAGPQRARPVAANLPGAQQQQASQASQFNSNGNYGEPVGQRRIAQSPAQILQQQQQQQQLNSYGNDDQSEPLQQQQVASASSTANRQPSSSTSSSSYGNAGNYGSPQRAVQSAAQSSSQFQPTTTINYNQQQQVAEQQRLDSPTKTSARREPAIITSTPASATTGATLAKGQAAARVAARPTFSMDLSQKVNSLIESPVRAPLGTTSAAPAPAKGRAPVASPPPSTRRPVQAQLPASNFARLAVARAQQQGSQNLNSAGRKSVSQSGAFQSRPQQTGYTQQAQQPAQQEQFDSELDEPQQRQQQGSFDDSPVQTSTAPAAPQRQQNRQQQLVIQSGGGPDGSSAITTQYDTLQPAASPFSQQQQQQQRDLEDSPPPQQPQQQQQLSNGAGPSNEYESTFTSDSNDPTSDDFRAAGAKAAASHNQNWYIMRSI